MRRSPKRSQLLVQGAAAWFAFAILPRPSRAAQFEFKLASSDAVELPATVRFVQMANAVKAETDGRMQINVFPNSQLGSQTAMLGQLRLGSIQMLNLQHSAYSSVVPVAQISSLGFAFTSDKMGLEALDGPLGAYVRREFAAKGLYAFRRSSLSGFRNVTSSTKPIHAAEDFTGFRLRVIAAAIFVDLFKALGASPTPLDANELYTALQTHLVDGQEGILQLIDSFRLFEVQRYLSLTNHIWSGEWLVANADAWSRLPSDIRDIVERNIDKHILSSRRDQVLLNNALPDKLRREGLTFNSTDTASMRARLAPYYTRWRAEFGSTAWTLLTDKVGKLV